MLATVMTAPSWLVSAAFGLFERPMLALQKMTGAQRIAWVFLLPNLVIFSAFTFLPIALNGIYATTGSDRILLGERPFVGVENFASLLACDNYLQPNSCERDIFWRAVHNTGYFVVVQVGLMVLFSLLTALILNRNIPLRGFFRGVFFYPVLLSPVVVALIWKWILQRFGVLNAGLEGLGMPTVNWLVEADWAFFWIVFVSIWAHMGFYTLILLAGLQAIPSDLYEAAEMDRTPRWRILWRITLPLLWPNMIVVIVLSLIKGVQTFDEVFVLTGGGPGTATLMVVQYIYETAFANQVQNFGLAAAASVVLGLVLFALTLAQLAATRMKER